MPQTVFTPRAIINALIAAEVLPAPVRIDLAVIRPDWRAIAQRAVERTDG